MNGWITLFPWPLSVRGKLGLGSRWAAGQSPAPCLPPFFLGPITGLQELPWPDSANMEEVAENAPREHFEANALAQSCCLNCFHPEEAHSPRHQVGRLS